MGRYYTGRRARTYYARLRAFTERTLSEALAMVDIVALRGEPGRLGRPPRVLDVACGTGMLLKHLCAQLPEIEAHGIDASADMLAQAHATLEGLPRRVRLEQIALSDGGVVTPPYATGTFDLIACTNALHDLPDPIGTLAGMGRLLAPEGNMVLEDFARREPPFPWGAFEWLVRRVLGRRVHVYTLAEARSLCVQAGLQIVEDKAFSVDWLLHGWALRASRAPGA